MLQNDRLAILRLIEATCGRDGPPHATRFAVTHYAKSSWLPPVRQKIRTGLAFGTTISSVRGIDPFVEPPMDATTMPHISWDKLLPMRARRAIQRLGFAGAARTVTSRIARKLGTRNGRALVGPRFLRINPMGFVCNHACPMCWIQQLDPEELRREKKSEIKHGLKLDDYRRLFDSMPLGLEEVNLVGGGEPLLHPQAVEIMREVKSRAWRSSLITNGTAMNEGVSRALIDMGWDQVCVSVHAGDPDTYRRIHGVDRFGRLIDNLTAFTRYRRACGAEERCELKVFHVLQRDNIATVSKLFEVAEQVGADTVEFDLINPFNDEMWLTPALLEQAAAGLRHWSSDVAIPANTDVIVAQLERGARLTRDDADFVPAKWCSVGFDQAFVNTKGEVVPCCFSDEIMGDLRRSRFDEIWYGKRYEEFRERLRRGRFADYCITNRCTLADVLHYD